MKTISMLLLTISFVAACAHGAGTEPVSFRATPPFPLLRQRWSQLAGPLANHTDRPRTLTAACLTHDPVHGDTSYTFTTTVAAQSVRQCQIPFFPVDFDAIRKPSSQSVEQVYELFDTPTGRKLATSAQPMRLPRASTAIIGLVQLSEGASDDCTYLKTITFAGKSRSKLVLTRADALPDRWWGYDSLTMCVLGNVPPSQLRESQLAALLQWVARGGCLILAGSPALPNLLNETPLGDAAGVTAGELFWQDTFNIVQRGELLGVVEQAEPVPFAHVIATDATVLYTCNDQAMATVRTVGDGQIVVLATSINAYAPDPLLPKFHLWRSLLQMQDTRSPINNDAFQGVQAEALQRIAGQPAPPVAIPMMILGGLIAGTMIVGFAMRLRRRGEWTWLLLIPITAILSVGLFVYSQTTHPPERLSFIGLMSDLGDGLVRSQVACAYSAGPDSETVTLTSGGPNATLRNLSQPASAALSTTQIQSNQGTLTLANQTVAPGATRWFATDSIRRQSLVTGEIRFGPTGATVMCTNALPSPIEDAVLLVEGHLYAVGTLAAGTQTPVTLSGDTYLGAVEFPHHSARIPNPSPKGKRTPPARGSFSSSIVPDRLKNRLVGQLITQPGFRSNVAPTPTLIGYTRHMPSCVLDKPVLRQGWSVVVASLQQSGAPTDGPAVFPAGFCPMTWINQGSPVWNPSLQAFNPMMRSGALRVDISLPRWVSDRDTEVDLTVVMHGAAYTLTVQGVTGKSYDPRQPMDVDTFANPNGSVTCRIPQAERFVSPEGVMHLRLQLELTYPDMETPDPTQMPSWKIQSIRATIRTQPRKTEPLERTGT
jgi:hypothetical protein